MARLDDLLVTDEAPTRKSLDDLLATDEATSPRSAVRTPTAEDMKALDEYNRGSNELPWYSRLAAGANDPLIGAGQIMQHVIPDAALNLGRKITDPIVNTIMGGEPIDTSKTTTADFDAAVQRREQGYQAERKAAGEEGLDWWRVGGALANPMSWLGPQGSGASMWNAVKSGAQQGAFQALLQPVTDSGSYLFDKAMQGTTGAAIGGTIGGALSLLKPVFSKGAETVRKFIGGSDDAAKVAAAQKITDDTLKAAEVDPAKVDPNLYSAIRQEVGDALKAGVDPDPKIMANRADAAALPVPIDLMRGQASRDPFQYSWEVNTSKLRDAGEPLAERISTQNRQLIENMNELGARNAPSTFDASQKIISHIDSVDAAAKQKINEAYALVRDSAGRPARVSNEAFAEASKNLLTDGRPELASLASRADYLPPPITKQYNDIISGKLPLTVDTIQFLDRNWGGIQRGASDDTTKGAIGALRTALNDAPVNDSLGQESMAAYKAAREMARQRFAMIESNPAYKAIDSGVEPDKFFQKYVQGANVSELAGLKNLIGAENTGMLQQTLIGNLKKAALNRASDENGVFSQAAYNKILQDPVQGPRLQELFKDNPTLLGQLYRVGRVAENIVAFPKGHGVNTSNTAPTTANIVRDMSKSEGGKMLSTMFPKIAGGAQVLKEGKIRAEVARGVESALKPGVTKIPLKAPAPSSQVKSLSDLAARAGASYASRNDDE